MVRCSTCRSHYNFPGGPIQYLPCHHFMCHFCLLQCLALSLVSPSCMPLRCCDSANGEIEVTSLKNLIIDPRINVAWNKYRLLAADDNWTCPRGHPPESGSLLVTNELGGFPPIWKEVVHCSGCLTGTQLVEGRRSGHSLNNIRPTSFCLLCSSEIETKECRRCEQNLVVWPFIMRLRNHLTRNTWLASAIDSACDARDKMREGKPLEYQTLLELARLPSPEESESDQHDIESTSTFGYRDVAPDISDVHVNHEYTSELERDRLITCEQCWHINEVPQRLGGMRWGYW
jgi:hypothetical protein